MTDDDILMRLMMQRDHEYIISKHDTLEKTINYIERLKAGISQWQPIETRPKPVYNEKTWENGQESFLVWDGKQAFCVDPDLYPQSNGCGCCSYQVQATHWMPVPKPPVTPEKTND